MAAGNDGAENMAATELIILIQDSISSGLLQNTEMMDFHVRKTKLELQEMAFQDFEFYKAFSEEIKAERRR